MRRYAELWVVLLLACSGSDKDDQLPVQDTADMAIEDSGVDLVGIDAGLDVPVGEDALELVDDVVPDLVEDSQPEIVPVDDVAELEPEDLGPPPPSTPVAEPEPVVLESWLVAYVQDPQNDPISDALDAGTFILPEEPGKDDNGIEWMERIPGENGKMGFASYGLFYAGARINLEDDAGIIVRADKFMQVHCNDNVQPGDPYMHRIHRTACRGIAGENTVLAVAYGVVNDPEIELWTTPDEIYFNPKDLTAPHLVAGDLTEQYLGVPVLNLTGEALRNTTARVVGNEWFEETEMLLPGLAPQSATKVPFHLVPVKAPDEPELDIPVTIRIESHDLSLSYETEYTVKSIEAGVPFKRTRLSKVDHSVQYYGVRPPTGEPPDNGYGLVLSLHGAGVQGLGQAQSYGPKEWAYIVAPTNRRRFGFDWEEWGRLDGLEALDHAMEQFDIDPTRVSVSGHSMGGHGTWQFGVHLSNRFRVVGPSAGWSTFYSYGGSTPPTGPFKRARASSFTLDYVGNLANRAVYIIHADKDDNVPISEAYIMQEAVEPIADEFYFHIEPDKGHWWDGYPEPGAQCVDWPELFEWMEDRTLDLTELDFEYKTPSPWINATYSYVSIRSQLDPLEDSSVVSESDGDAVSLTTYNVRGMTLDGAALLDKGVTSLTVDGDEVELTAESIDWGSQDGKRPDLQGPFNQVFHKPFCYVYSNYQDIKYKQYVSYLVSTWTIIGNGHACALPIGKLTPEVRSQYNIIYVGIPVDKVPVPDSIPFTWDEDSITVDGKTVDSGTLLFVFPEEDHLSAAWLTTPGEEFMLFWHSPFSSRSGMPDYVGWTNGGAYLAGFFDPDWNFVPALGIGP